MIGCLRPQTKHSVHGCSAPQSALPSEETKPADLNGRGESAPAQTQAAKGEPKPARDTRPLPGAPLRVTRFAAAVWEAAGGDARKAFALAVLAGKRI